MNREAIRLRLGNALALYPATTPWALALPTPEHMARLDRATMALGVSNQELMERAGEAVTEVILDLLGDFVTKARIVVLCGPGSNGGDGHVIARLLRERGVPFDRLSTISSKEAPPADIGDTLARSDIVVDALLGTGQRDAARGVVEQLIRELQSLRCRATADRPLVVAVDLPSGVDARDGQCFEPHVRADITVCIELIKRGLTQFPAREACGVIHSVTIGIEERIPVPCRLLTDETVPILEKRSADSHKGKFGHVFVVGGSREMPGAPVLSARAALRSGAGLVTLGKGDTFLPVEMWPELMVCELPAPQGAFDSTTIEKLSARIEDMSVVVLGPGLGKKSVTEEFVAILLTQLKSAMIPAVIDADGLNILASLNKKNSLPHCGKLVLTPHPSEMARLLDIETATVQKTRFECAEKAAVLYGAIVVLKGASTIVSDGVRTIVNTTGGPELATPGSGDVLAGLIGALIGQGLSLFDAAALGVFAHGRAGSLASEQRGGAIIASDIIDHLARAISREEPVHDHH